MLSNPHDYLMKLRWIYKIEPTTVYDIGVGFGTFGAMIRERREMPYLRWKREQWEGTLCGCEIYGPYIEEFKHLEYLYDNIEIGSIYDIIQKPDFGMWDVIHAGDVIEHLDKEEANFVLDEIPKHCKHFILSIPIEEIYMDIGDHPNEALNHKSVWHMEDEHFQGWYKAMGNRGNAGQINTYWFKYDKNFFE